MSTCEKCWSDAYTRSRLSDVDQADHYARLLIERREWPCTQEQQAGPDASECPDCHRNTLHQVTKEPMCWCLAGKDGHKRESRT